MAKYWITRPGLRTDRVACAWLVRRFLDPSAEFLFVPEEQIAEKKRELGAVSYDVAGGDYAHRGGKVTFEVILEEFGLVGKDPALDEMARIVHDADVPDDQAYGAVEGKGLWAMAQGFAETTPDDHEKLRLELPMYDALYAYCRRKVAHQLKTPTRKGAGEP